MEEVVPQEILDNSDQVVQGPEMTFKASKCPPKVGREISPYLQLQRHFGTYKTSPIALKFCIASLIVISLLGIRCVK